MITTGLKLNILRYSLNITIINILTFPPIDVSQYTVHIQYCTSITPQLLRKEDEGITVILQYIYYKAPTYSFIFTTFFKEENIFSS